MFEKSDKRRLYWLIDQYLVSKIDAGTFCDEFYYSYNLEIDYKILSEEEQEVFSDLSTVVSRFSEFEEDICCYPKAYFTEEQLKKKIVETKEKLKTKSPI
ncbi:MAG: hypothetical protein JJT94_14240 [Bernardetiaceae bacterium]|nr:hypothetical protein [Bernardetiaceae bacterium]